MAFMGVGVGVNRDRNFLHQLAIAQAVNRIASRAGVRGRDVTIGQTDMMPKVPEMVSGRR